MVTLVLLALIALTSPQAPAPPPPPAPQPPRDVVRAERAGTGVIRGRVVAADTGLPIRQATVTLGQMMSVGGRTVIAGTVEGVGGVATLAATAGAQRPAPPVPMRPRSTRTDDQGAFEFKALPAGSYRINASTGQFSAQYLPLAYGSKRPMMDPGLPIDLADGQTFDKATIALPRGGVIVGRITDENGDPMARVQVLGLYFAPGSTRGQRWGPTGFSQTDDLGQFRLYGLQPGDYAVVAEARMSTFMSANAPLSESDEDRTGFVTTYFPGTADEASAQRVRVRSGVETPGIEIRMMKGRLYRVSGLILDSHGTPLSGVNGAIVRRTTGSGFMNNGFSTDEQGRFQLQNLAPGTYRLSVRQRQQAFGPNGPEGDPGEMANVPIAVAGADIENLTIVTAPGVTLKGRIEFEPAPPQRLPTEMRISAVPADPDEMMSGPQPNTVVQRDMTFRLQGLSGEFMIRSFGGVPPNSFVKAVLLGGVDISDAPREFKNGDEVTVVVSSRPSSIEGTVTDTKGSPITDAGIILFPDDKALWRANVTRVRRGSPDGQGRYRLSPLHPGAYFILAAPRERLNTPPGTDYAVFYQELSRDATTVVINEDETRTVDLKVVIQGGGQ